MSDALLIAVLVVVTISLAALLLLLARERTSARETREELARSLHAFTQNLTAQLASGAGAQHAQSEALRGAVEQRLDKIQKDNAEKLEQMRKTVDDKLHETLDKRLSDSFRVVSERLELVHKGLGEMQVLAAGVGDLRRVLSNVKNRGVLGEIQLAALLEQMLTREQYETNVATRPGSRERVEFAIRLPGQNGGSGAVWLPIDAKFPLEDYEQLQKAQDAADALAVESAGRALEARIRQEARSIVDKYVEPPATTDFALLYLPLEGLYAEVLRRPGLLEALQREYRVTVCGPTTLSAFLNSLQMGFRTLAIERRSSEVWQVLGGVKSEFGKFAEVLANTKKQLQTVANSIDQAEVRTRQIERRLKDVETLPGSTPENLTE
ncbi:MAG: DNA recombination protein RmuC [Burkholderiales bacterium]